MDEVIKQIVDKTRELEDLKEKALILMREKNLNKK